MITSRHIGILGGSFNPVHTGHIILADYLVQFTGLDEVWLMLSPANPLKTGNAAPDIPDTDRYSMLDIATDGIKGVRPCDIELSMPRPSYTIDSLRELHRRFPHTRFSLIIGSDNWLIFDRWREHRAIIEEFTPIVYPRPGYEIDPATLPPEVTFVNAPTIDLSSTFIRRAIAEGHDMTAFMPHGVGRYITSHNLYQPHK